MKIVIVEDEFFAARRLENMIHEYDSSIKILAKLESVKESVDWFKENEQPDLIFLDIHLDDDLSFSIFKEVEISCPIIFTTATDEFATQAFLMHSIGYLHKPIIQDDLNLVLKTYQQTTVTPMVIDGKIFDEIINQKNKN